MFKHAFTFYLHKLCSLRQYDRVLVVRCSQNICVSNRQSARYTTGVVIRRQHVVGNLSNSRDKFIEKNVFADEICALVSPRPDREIAYEARLRVLLQLTLYILRGFLISDKVIKTT